MVIYLHRNKGNNISKKQKLVTIITGGYKDRILIWRTGKVTCTCEWMTAVKVCDDLSVLFTQIKAGDIWKISFFLKTKQFPLSIGNMEYRNELSGPVGFGSRFCRIDLYFFQDLIERFDVAHIAGSLDIDGFSGHAKDHR